MAAASSPAAAPVRDRPVAPATAHLSIKGLRKEFQGGRGTVVALEDIDLVVPRGEFVTIIGPSGCGKSTLLRIIAGLEGDHSGTVCLDGRKIAGPGSDRGVIFQEHRLFPWLNVEQNIAANASLRDPAIKRRVGELIELVRMKGFEAAYPRELSGGMAQRVAIARALLRDPSMLLLDEPFGALDSFTRAHMQAALQDIWRRNRMTAIFVTHDIDEAVFLADRVVMMTPRPGQIHDIMPIDIERPRDRTGVAHRQARQLLLEKFEGLTHD